MTLKETFRRIETDYQAISQLMKIKLTVTRRIFLFFSPSIMAITLYRFSRYWYLKKVKPLAWFLWQANTYLTGVEIMPTSDIGDYFYLGHPVGAVISAKIGSHAVLMGQAAIGGGFNQEDIGAGNGLPVIGDHVIVGIRACILGPVRIGSHSVIGAMSYVSKDVPERSTAVGSPCRILPTSQGQEDMKRIVDEL